MPGLAALGAVGGAGGRDPAARRFARFVDDARRRATSARTRHFHALDGARPRRRSGRRCGTSAGCRATAGATASSSRPSRSGRRGSSPTPRCNVAEALLRDPGDDLAIVFAREDGAATHAHPDRPARARVAGAAGIARRRGGTRRSCRGVDAERTRDVRADARAASLGAVFSSTSPDFGVEGVVDRFGQIEPTVLVAADAYLLQRHAVRLPRPSAGDPRPAAVGANRRRARLRRRRLRSLDGVPRRRAWTDWLAPLRRTCGRVRARCRSTTRGTCCSRRALPARRSASCTGPAACCSSTCRSSSSSATSAPATGSATSRPRAG